MTMLRYRLRLSFTGFYATDFKPEYANTCLYATSLACEFQAEMALLHVIEDYGDRLLERPGPIDSALMQLETDT